MANVKVINPDITVLEYNQEKTDKDYGSCLWAKFYFDTTNCELLITSDCGNYAYGWCSDTKPFLSFLASISKGYLLSKIAKQSEVDCDATYLAVKEYIGDDTDVNDDEDELLYVCHCSKNKVEVYKSLEDYFYGEMLDFETESLNDCIICSYPTWAKRIADIFVNYIQPLLKEFYYD